MVNVAGPSESTAVGATDPGIGGASCVADAWRLRGGSSSSVESSAGSPGTGAGDALRFPAALPQCSFVSTNAVPSGVVSSARSAPWSKATATTSAVPIGTDAALGTPTVGGGASTAVAVAGPQSVARDAWVLHRDA